MNSEILLCTLNARYSHSAFGLRYLMANLGVLKSRAQIMEFTISQSPSDIVEQILAASPRIVGFGVYIWNSTQTYQIVSILKRLQPSLVIVLGGPEVSYEFEDQAICKLADHVIRGEAEILFRDLCIELLEMDSGAINKRPGHVISGPLPEISSLVLPYSLYTDSDISNRVLYVEASRGCPYKCEYCLSSLDKSVRNFPLQAFLTEMQGLIDRGARQFKFVDRTFNLSIPVSTAILEFFLKQTVPLFIHFEMVPDRLPIELRDLITRFAPGALQFEIGIQTWNPVIAARVSRRQDYAKIVENLEFLGTKTGVHTHADLIAGLPGEDWQSFARGFDALCALGPDEIQVGILKRLKGTPITRHDTEWAMVYSEHPPFQILSTKVLSFDQIQRISRFSKHWDFIANSGNFIQTLKLLKGAATQWEDQSFFNLFLGLSDHLSVKHPQSHSIALLNLVESLWTFLSQNRYFEGDQVRQALIEDYAVTVKREVPKFLRMDVNPQSTLKKKTRVLHSLPERQRKHSS